MNQGFISEWSASNGVGKIHGCSMQPEREFRFFGKRCCQELQVELAKPESANIHCPGPCPGIGCIQVKFDIDLNADAVNVCQA